MSLGSSIEVSASTLQSFLRFHSAVNLADKVVVTKKTLLDLIERLQPKGPISEGKQQSIARASFSRKLSRNLQNFESFHGVWNPVKGERGPDTYDIDIIKTLLTDFGMSVSQRDWETVLTNLQEAAVKGQMPRDQSGGYQTEQSSAMGEMALVETNPESVALADVPRSLVDQGNEPLPFAPEEDASQVSVSGLSTSSLGLVRSQPGGEQVGQLPLIPYSVSSTDVGNHMGSFGKHVKKRKAFAESTTFTNYAQLYGGHSWSDLLECIVDREDEIKRNKQTIQELTATNDKLRKKVKLLSQQSRRVGKAVVKWQAKAAAKTIKGMTPKQQTLSFHGRSKESSTARGEATIEQKMAIVRTGSDGAGRYLTVPSRISLSIRRNLSNIACGDLSLVLLDDASRWTIARAEVHAGACLLASARSFHTDMSNELQSLEQGVPSAPSIDTSRSESGGGSGMAVSIHSMSQDATNSGIWQKRKLCALILDSAFCPSLPREGDSADFKTYFNSMVCVADIQPVGGSTATATVGLTHKMLGSLGCPSVYDLIERSKKIPDNARCLR